MLRTRVRVGLASGLVLSALFAALFTAVGTFELFLPALEPAYGQPAPLALRIPYGARVVRQGGAELIDVRYEQRRIVVGRGTVLQPGVEDHRAAVHFDRQRRPPTLARLASAFALYLFGCLVLTNYFQRFGHNRLRLLRAQIGVLLLVLVALVGAKALLVLTTLPPFWVPLAAITLWLALVFDRRTALLVDVALAFMVASLLRFDLMLLAVFITRGIGAGLLFLDRKDSRHMLTSGLLAGLASAAAYVALVVLFEGQSGAARDLARGFHSNLVACVGGGVLSGVLAALFREPAEAVVGHVSRSRLLDLTDIESPLLRKMAETAPGSWEHSRAMANLAEAAAASIGADSLLTRVGAYYHDLGKTIQPKYFIENLAPGEASPHDELAPEVSADAIMAHVVLGTQILREAGVPEDVVEFAYTHHGTQLVEYFWDKYCKLVPEGERKHDRGHFRYPGMKPLTKETAILMLVDSIEAASRTIVPPTQQGFEEMIRRIVFAKLAAGQLDDCGISLPELRALARRIAGTLVNMYHGRIKYPWQEEREPRDSGGARASGDGSATPPPVTPGEATATPPPVSSE
jgi:putative nucleotidyltransferase with HDIG domain